MGFFFSLSLLLKVCSDLYSPTNSLSKPTLFLRRASLPKVSCHRSTWHHPETLISKLGRILLEQGSGHLENHQEDKCVVPHAVTTQTLDSSSLSTKWSPQTQGRERDKDPPRSHCKPEAKNTSPDSQCLTLILDVYLSNFFVGTSLTLSRQTAPRGRISDCPIHGPYLYSLG